MRIDPGQMILGIPAMDLRNAFKRLRRGRFDHGSLRSILNLDEPAARKLMLQLCDAGFVENDHKEFFQLSVKGNALAMATAAKSVSKINAEKTIAEFLERVRIVNCDSQYLYGVLKTVLFGSYLNDSVSKVNDIDIAIQLHRKEQDPDEYWELRKQKIAKEKK
jgi:predicted nucleotidyltransferase